MEFSYIESICIYILIILGTTLFVYKADLENKRYFLVIAYLIMTIPSMIRYCVGIDYEPYLRLYEQIVKVGSIEKALKLHIVEYSFMYLSFISNILFGSGLLVFAFYSAFTQLFMLAGIWYFRKNVSPALIVFLYLCGYYWRTYNIFRQALAVALVFFAYRYIRERKLVKYIICVAIAGCFHTTAFLAIVVYFYFNLQFEKSLKIFNYILPAFLIALLDPIMDYVYSLQIFSNYGNYYQRVNLSPFTLGTMLELLVLLFYFIVQSKKSSMPYDVEERNFFDKVMIIDFTFTILLYYVFFAARVGLYFTIAKSVAMGSIHVKGEHVSLREISRYDAILIAYYIFVFVRCMLENSYGQLPYQIW